MDRIQARKLLKGAFILFSIYFLLNSAIRSLFADFTASEISDSGLWEFLMVFRIFQSCHRIFYIHPYASLPYLKFYLLHKDSHCECVLFILLFSTPVDIYSKCQAEKSQAFELPSCFVTMVGGGLFPKIVSSKKSYGRRAPSSGGHFIFSTWPFIRSFEFYKFQIRVR